MHSDPILREVHRMKDESAREMDYDIHKIFQRMQENEKKHTERIVGPPPLNLSKANRRTAGKKAAK